MVQYERLEFKAVIHMLTRFEKPFQTREWLEGKNWDAQISDVMEDIGELSQDPLAEGFVQSITEKQAQLAEYTELNKKRREKGDWKYTDVLNDDGSVKTEGQHFFGLDREGRREYLKTYDVRAEKSADSADGIRLIIAGEEVESTPFEADFVNLLPSETLRAVLEQQIPNAAEWQALLRGGWRALLRGEGILGSERSPKLPLSSRQAKDPPAVKAEGSFCVIAPERSQSAIYATEPLAFKPLREQP
jgi:hypothetical protein